MYDGGRRGLPMYDVRRTMYDLQIRARCAGRWRRERRPCTMYDLNASARCAGKAERERARCR